jgi:hypothetical protein
MKEKIKNLIEQYQCPGCAVGGNISCFKPSDNEGVGYGNHTSGTLISFVGKFVFPVFFTYLCIIKH